MYTSLGVITKGTVIEVRISIILKKMLRFGYYNRNTFKFWQITFMTFIYFFILNVQIFSKLIGKIYVTFWSSALLWSSSISMFFRYIGRLVTRQQKCHFILSSLHFCLLFGFVFICIMCSCNPGISGFSATEIKAINVYRPYLSEENRNVVVFCKADS